MNVSEFCNKKQKGRHPLRHKQLLLFFCTRYPNNGTFPKEDFCLATTWEDSTGIEYSKEEAITLRCDYCSENVKISLKMKFSLEFSF